MADPAHGSREDNTLAEFLAPGVVPQDLPDLFPLLSARKLFSTFTALFHGGAEAVMVRLLVLREIGGRADAPQWTPSELETRFAYLDPVKLDTVLKRLREHELLVWDIDRRVYQLSPTGRMALAALDQLLRFSQEEDAELGYITSQIAAGTATGRVSTEVLRHLLARLAELEQEFAAAVQLGSEFRLKAARDKLQSVWQWMEKGTEVMKNLGADGLPDDATWRLAQEIGARQSRIMRMEGVFQRELSKIARQQVHLSQGGLTSSELAAWLREQGVERLTSFAAGVARAMPETAFVLPDVMLDTAEFELCERKRDEAKHSSLPPAMETTESSHIEAPDPPPELPQFTALLSGINAPTHVSDVVVGGGYRSAAYRFSLLPLIGETTAAPDLAAFATLGLRLEWDVSDPRDTSLEPVGRDGVAAISGGQLVPQLLP